MNHSFLSTSWNVFRVQGCEGLPDSYSIHKPLILPVSQQGQRIPSKSSGLNLLTSHIVLFLPLSTVAQLFIMLILKRFSIPDLVNLILTVGI